MAFTYRGVWGFSGNGEGWTESHMMQAASHNPKDLLPAWTLYAQKRVLSLGDEFSIVGGRISRYLAEDGTRDIRGSLPIKATFKGQAGTAEPANVALLIVGHDVTGAKSNQTFLGAPPDDAVSAGGVVNPAKAGLDKAFAAIQDFLTGGTQTVKFGWGGSTTLYNVKIQSSVQGPNGNVDMTFLAGTFNPGDITKQFPARIRGVNSGRSPMNGQCNVTLDSAIAASTVEVIGIPTDQKGGFLRVYAQVRPFVAYQDIALELFVARHNRGRPFGSPRGRASKRVRG